MSGTLNKVMLIGHTGEDIKMTWFDNGGCIGRFPLATNETYTNRTSGERVTNTEWHNIVMRNKAAEICEKYLKKGDKIYVEGRLKTRKWQDDQGRDRYSTEIQCTEFTFLSPKAETGMTAPAAATAPATVQQPVIQQPKVEEPIGDDDDLPF